MATPHFPSSSPGDDRPSSASRCRGCGAPLAANSTSRTGPKSLRSPAFRSLLQRATGGQAERPNRSEIARRLLRNDPCCCAPLAARSSARTGPKSLAAGFALPSGSSACTTLPGCQPFAPWRKQGTSKVTCATRAQAHRCCLPATADRYISPTLSLKQFL